MHPREIELGLERVRTVWHRHRKDGLPFAVIAIAGTNGKGSVAELLDSIYRAAGYRTGCYTSPHLVRYNERVRVNGEEATDEQLCRAFARIDAARRDTALTYFEFGTLVAVDVFLAVGVDVAILEVGLGGRLDAVNLFDADVAIVSAVGIDHTDWLGPDRESIGREKAGIFRAGQAAICGDADPPVSLVAEAQRLDSRFLQVDRDFGFSCNADACRWYGPASTIEPLPRPALPGEHQLHNAACALMAVAELAVDLPVDQAAVREGLLTACLPGRLQTLPGTPCSILDVAHNPQAVEALAAVLRARENRGRIFAVLGMMRDKAIGECMGIVAPLVDCWFLATLPGPRGAAAMQLREQLNAVAPDAIAQEFETTVEAYTAARAAVSADDCIVVFGSFETVGAIMRHSSGQ